MNRFVEAAVMEAGFTECGSLSPRELRFHSEVRKICEGNSCRNYGASWACPPAVGTLGLGSYTDEIAVDHAPGNFMTTGNPLDLAISGNGFFVIDTPEGPRYTRNGNFYRAVNGDLVNSDGRAVLSRQGRPINIPENAANIMVTAEGGVYADGAQLGMLGFVEFDGDPRALLKQGDSLFYPQAGAEPQPATGAIQQGVLERSNANVVNEMVDLITNYRIYEANSKAVTTQDTMLDHSVNEVGRL